MVSINYSAREVCCKIVFYGPGLSGKTTNLQYVHAKVPGNTRGNLISLATEADRTLYFDFLPINIGSINGFAAKFQLYTVPGQVYYNATRKLVLRGVDGIVFVGDSQPDKMDENVESLVNLDDNLREYGYDINELPIVIQYNKRDLPGVLPVSEMESRLNGRGWPFFEASATIGNGVFDTLKLIIKLVLEKAKGAGASRSQPPAAVAVGTAIPAGATPSVATESAATSPVENSGQPAAAVATALPQPPEAPGPSAPVTKTVVSDPDVGAEPTAHRPFPGDRTGAVPTEQSAPAVPLQPEVAAPVPVTNEIAENIEQASDSKPTDTNEVTTEIPQAGPAMAPSLRRRTKKRGFFRRLFGMK